MAHKLTIDEVWDKLSYVNVMMMNATMPKFNSKSIDKSSKKPSGKAMSMFDMIAAINRGEGV